MAAIKSKFIAKNGLNNNNKTIINVADPVNAQDGANKNYSANATNVTTGTLDTARVPDFNTLVTKISSMPTAYPDLNLDFVNNTNLDSRITFNRASIATRVNRNGLVEVVGNNIPRFDYDPVTKVCKGLLIEEQRTNLLTYSNNFDNASWIKTDLNVIPNAAIAPNGSFSASKLIPTSGVAINSPVTSYTVQYVSKSATSTTYTESVYAKAAGFNRLRIRTRDSANSANNATAVVSLIDGTITGAATANGTFTNAAINVVALSDGWFRIALTFTTSTETNIWAGLYQIYDSTYSVGDGVSGIYVWGAQLEAGSFATSYIPSTDTFTSRASTATYIGSDGLIKTAASNTARYSYNPSNLSVSPQLLLEAASTNLFMYSEQIDNVAWNKVRATVIANSTIAPDGVGSADKIVEDTSTTITHLIRSSAIALPASTQYTITIFAKAAERSQLVVSAFSTAFWSVSSSIRFDLLAGTATLSGGTNIPFTIQYVADGWYRCSISPTTDATTNTRTIDFQLSNNNIISYTGDGVSGIYIWGAQLEALPYATSYIPTTSTQVTRAADVSSSAQTVRSADIAKMTGTNFSSWYNQSEGTIFADYTIDYKDTYTSVLRLSDTTGNNIIGMRYASSTQLQYVVSTNGINQVNLGLTGYSTLNKVYKRAITYKENSFQQAIDGILPQSEDTSGILPFVSTLNIGSAETLNEILNGHIRKISYYKTRLSNTQLQGLTM